MAANIVFNCDICGNPKRETNHWWMILTNEKNEAKDGLDVQGDIQGNIHSAEPHSADSHNTDRRFLVVPWKAELATHEGVHHACGQLCVLRAIERFMSEAEIFAEVGTEIAAGAHAGVAAYEERYANGYAGQLLAPVNNFNAGDPSGSDEGYADLDPVVDEATVNAVAQSVVQSVMDSQLNTTSDIAYAYDVDEEGELSAVLSPAKPKQVSKSAVTSNHRASLDGPNGPNGTNQHLTAA